MLSEKILEAARHHLEGKKVTDLVLGISLIGVELDGRQTGVAYTLRDNLPSGCGSFSFASKLIGADAIEAASLCVSGKDDIQRGVAAAILNAAANNLTLKDFEDRSRPFGVVAQPDDRLALIGYMAPIAKQFEGIVKDTVIFDRGRELAGMADVTPCELQEEVLPSCDIVVVSGTSVTNGSIDHLLELCSNAREFILTGTSTPLFPEGYADSKVTCLAGSLWKASNKEDIFRRIALGGGIASCRDLMIKKCVRLGE